MNRLLITGANSYIGTSVETYLQKFKDKYIVETIDMIDGSWREKDFSNYDCVFHVAGLAHADVGKVTKEVKSFYYKINTELAIETAKKAKSDGVKQFIFMSSMIVYGESAPIGKNKIIKIDTKPEPANFYGDSKLRAEQGILPLSEADFKVVVVRPPMIFGKDSKGNYPILSKIAKKIPVFPLIKNQRSMLHIDNLCEFIYLMIANGEKGLFFPQNKEYIQTSRLVKRIAAIHHKKVISTRIFNPFVFLLSKFPGEIGGMVNKAFGNLVYDKKMSDYKNFIYCVNDFKESINKTEK
ncbi:NAD-dependent epimerase/dehydratase family protein [Lachnospiraceae bacterium ZAX-1]